MAHVFLKSMHNLLISELFLEKWLENVKSYFYLFFPFFCSTSLIRYMIVFYFHCSTISFIREGGHSNWTLNREGNARHKKDDVKFSWAPSKSEVVQSFHENLFFFIELVLVYNHLNERMMFIIFHFRPFDAKI